MNPEFRIIYDISSSRDLARMLKRDTIPISDIIAGDIIFDKTDTPRLVVRIDKNHIGVYGVLYYTFIDKDDNTVGGGKEGSLQEIIPREALAKFSNVRYW